MVIALTCSWRMWQVSPRKVLRAAFGIRALSTTYIQRVFVKTEMTLKSRAVLTGSRQLTRSRSTENLPTSQSQVNIQMMSHTLTIREVSIDVPLWLRPWVYTQQSCRSHCAVYHNQFRFNQHQRLFEWPFCKLYKLVQL